MILFSLYIKAAMTLPWRDQLSVGNDLIDSDHRRLIEIVNEAELNLNSRDLASLSQVLEELERYSKQHFEREEAVANAVVYPGGDQLHRAHRELMVSLVRKRTDLDCHDGYLAKWVATEPPKSHEQPMR